MRTWELEHAETDVGLDAAVRARADVVVGTCEHLGVPVRYLGVAPVFDETRVYGAPGTVWLIAPAESDPLLADGRRMPIPDEQRRALQTLVDGGLDFPRIYVAHEVDRRHRERVRRTLQPAFGTDTALARSAPHELLRRSPFAPQNPTLPPDVAREVVETPPAPPGPATRLADRLNLWLAGAEATISKITQVLDPVVFGAVPVTAPQTSDPAVDGLAAWFVLARWAW